MSDDIVEQLRAASGGHRRLRAYAADLIERQRKELETARELLRESRQPLKESPGYEGVVDLLDAFLLSPTERNKEQGT